jgi:NAD(P)-dependent dehydrogenase (short-subunit alcohol dehydrogenase family)
MQINDRVVLITGARRIGAAVALDLAARGAHVSICYHASAEPAEQLASEIRALGRQATIWQADVGRAEDCEALIAHTLETLGRLDVLINMASVYRQVPFDDLREQDWNAPLAVDLRGSYLCARAAVPHMRARGGGRIINFSDWVAYSGRPRYQGYLPYFVAKTAVIGLTQALALELAADNILVNAIAPGPILPPAHLDRRELEAVERATPLGRWGGPAEVAKAVVAFIESDFITGEALCVDGGRHVR